MAAKREISAWDAELQVYEPHKNGLPNLRRYFKVLFERLPFAAEYSRSGIRAAHSQTVFGQIWLILNPLLLTVVYYFLVVILRGVGGLEVFVHIMGGLFVFFYFSGAISAGAGSVTGGGKLILNLAFPRLLMPLAAVRTAFFRFIPTLPLYFIVAFIAGTRLSWQMLYGFIFFILLTLFSFGMAALMAAVQVYFRDLTSFLPYFVRIWLYASPVLWTVGELSEKWQNILIINPLYSLISGWTDTVLYGTTPSLQIWLAAIGWSLAAAIFGSWFFMSRERDFAVRL